MRHFVPTIHRLTQAERAAAREAARADRKTIIKRYATRESLARIADDYRVSEPWLRLRLKEWHVPRRPLHESHAHRRPPGHVFRGRMPRRSKAEVEQAQTECTDDRDDVISRYQAGESAARLSREYRVNPAWLAWQLETWGVKVRDRSAAAAVRGPGVRPL